MLEKQSKPDDLVALDKATPVIAETMLRDGVQPVDLSALIARLQEYAKAHDSLCGVEGTNGFLFLVVRSGGTNAHVSGVMPHRLFEDQIDETAFASYFKPEFDNIRRVLAGDTV